MAVPDGSGFRISIDRDADTILDGDPSNYTPGPDLNLLSVVTSNNRIRNTAALYARAVILAIKYEGQPSSFFLYLYD